MPDDYWQDIDIDVYFFDPVSDVRMIYKTNGEIGREGEFATYIWEDGNYSCDCNRRLFMGLTDVGEDDRCGDEVIIEKITPRDKPDEVLYREEHHA